MRFAAMLIEGGARLDLRDDLLKSTPLGWACRWGREQRVDLLVDRGSPIDEPGAKAWATPLEWAKKMGHTAIERRLRVSLHDSGIKITIGSGALLPEFRRAEPSSALRPLTYQRSVLRCDESQRAKAATSRRTPKVEFVSAW